MTDMDELAAALSLEIAEAVMGNPTVEAVFSPDDLDGFKSDIQIEAVRVLNSHFARSRPSLSPAGVTEEQVEAAWREETEAEHLARDIRQGNFPSRSDRQLVPNVDDAWTRIGKDPELERARQKLSMHEIRLIIRHASRAALEVAAVAQPSISTGQGRRRNEADNGQAD